MSFIPYIMTPNGPRVIFPLEQIVSKEEVKKEDVSSIKELEDKLLHHIAKRFKTIEDKIRKMGPAGPSGPSGPAGPSGPSGPAGPSGPSSAIGNIDLSALEKEIKKQLKDEIKDFLCSDCIKEGQYDLDKKTFNDLLENKVKELSTESYQITSGSIKGK